MKTSRYSLFNYKLTSPLNSTNFDSKTHDSLKPNLIDSTEEQINIKGDSNVMSELWALKNVVQRKESYQDCIKMYY